MKITCLLLEHGDVIATFVGLCCLAGVLNQGRMIISVF